MREILFRGKRVDNGKWVEGNLIIDYDSGLVKILSGNGFVRISYYVDPETVGQYTGLIDSAEKKIFENDILKLTSEIDDFEWIAVVKFGNPNGEYNWGFQLVKINGDGVNTDILLWVEMDGAYAEVIGNIYDTPELLKGDDEICDR